MPCAKCGNGCGCFGNAFRGRRNESSQSPTSRPEMAQRMEPAEDAQGAHLPQAARTAQGTAEQFITRGQRSSRSLASRSDPPIQARVKNPRSSGDRDLPRASPRASPAGGENASSSGIFRGKSVKDHNAEANRGSVPTGGAMRSVLPVRAAPRSEGTETSRIASKFGNSKNFDFSIQITEARFLISARAPANNFASVRSFSNSLVQRFNRQAREGRPEERFDLMSEVVRTSVPAIGLNTKWHINEDSSTPPSYSKPVSITLSSPGYEPKPGRNSTWLAKLEQGWKFLDRNYVIQDQGEGHTYIDVVSRQFRWKEYKNILQAIIHFEPVTSTFFDRKTPSTVPKRNFADNLAFQTKTAMAAVQAIEREDEIAGCVGEPYLRQLQDLFEPEQHGGYAWGILIADQYALAHGIRWKIPAAIGSTAQLTAWVEFLAEFIQSAVHYDSPSDLFKYPPTTEGLVQFMTISGPHVTNRPIRSDLFAPLKR